MRRLTRLLLWLFVFSLPWGLVSTFPGIGTISRLLGIVAISLGGITALAAGRIRKPGTIFWFALVFTVASVLSLSWTIAYADTVERAVTYIQFVGLIWVLREFARTREEQDSLRLAFCLGAFIFAFDTLRNFMAGVHTTVSATARFSASGINPNYVGFTLVIGFLMAWHLFLHERGVVRAIAFLFCLMAPVVILLTAGRGSFIAALVALSIVPLTLRLKSFRSLVSVAMVLLVAGLTIGLLVPRQNWERLLTIKSEVSGGTMSGRTQIWDVGWLAFQARPILGAGAGAFPAAIEPLLFRGKAAHNVPLALLVEQGIVGLCLFAILLGACVWVIIGLPSSDRKVWAVLMVAWAVYGGAGDTHFDKITWLWFGLLAAQESAKTSRRQQSEPAFGRVEAVLGEELLHPEPPRRIASIAASH